MDIFTCTQAGRQGLLLLLCCLSCSHTEVCMRATQIAHQHNVCVHAIAARGAKHEAITLMRKQNGRFIISKNTHLAMTRYQYMNKKNHLFVEVRVFQHRAPTRNPPRFIHSVDILAQNTHGKRERERENARFVQYFFYSL